MPDHFYDVQKYEATMKSEVLTLTIVAVVLILCLIATIILSIENIKENKTKKWPYIISSLTVIMFIFVEAHLGLQISSYKKDISEKAYVQYEGPASCTSETFTVSGAVPTKRIEYIISFEHNGEQIELRTYKNYNLPEKIKKIYIVYSKDSKIILELVE